MTYYIYQLTTAERIGFEISPLPQSEYTSKLRQTVANVDFQVQQLATWSGSQIAAKRVLYGFLQAYFDDQTHHAGALLIRKFKLAELVDSLAQAEQMWAFEAKVNRRSGFKLDLGLQVTKKEADIYLANHRNDTAGLIDQIINGQPKTTVDWDQKNPANAFFDLYKAHVDEEHVLPVMYRTFYPTNRVPNYESNPLCRYIKGLKYNDYEYKQLEHDCFVEHGGVAQYTKDFTELLKRQPGDQFVLVGIPSSKVAKVNVIKHIIADLAKNDPKHFIDGTSLLQRTVDGAAAHEGNDKNRRIDVHMQEWNPHVNVDLALKKLPIIVIDDVLTSGASFDAADRFLYEVLGLPLNHIMNFAYGKSVMYSSLPNWQRPVRQRVDQTISAVIFDLDQTLFNTIGVHKYDYKTTEYWRAINQAKPYNPAIIEKVNALSLPYAIVTSNRENMASFLLGGHWRMFGNPAVAFGGREVFALKPAQNTNLHPDVTRHPLVVTAADVGETIISHGKPKTIYHVKPETNALDEAIKRLALPDGSYVLGVGNTIGDMQAYRAAGMVTVFVNYGNRVKLSHILTLADYFAETPEELLDILQRVAAKPVPDFPEIDDSDLPF